MALTHANLLESWRERALSGQAETRRVLGEMLTPSGNGAGTGRVIHGAHQTILLALLLRMPMLVNYSSQKRNAPRRATELTTSVKNK